MFWYFLKRLLKSLISVVAVIVIVYILIYSLIPKEKILEKDNVNLQGKTGDNRTTFIYQQYENYGYIDFYEYSEYCAMKFEIGTPEYLAAVSAELGTANDESDNYVNYCESKGYTIQYYNISKKPYAFKDNSPLKMLGKFFSRLVYFDNKNYALNTYRNDTVERKVYIGKDWSGVPAVMCSGCKYKYQLYFDGKFPFIHQNWLNFNLGNSYPTYSGSPILDVIGLDNQGEDIRVPVTYPTGYEGESAILEHTCQFKDKVDGLDSLKFTDNYSNCNKSTTGYSMVGTSFIIGVFSFIIAYMIGIPVGIIMARKKGKWFDKLGIAYIIFIIAVPSLVYIFIFQRIGGAIGLPMKFPMWGESAIGSYILPTISLALPSAAGLMMWMRRYMIDQSSADYVKFARSKGLSEGEIFSRHIMRNAIVPITHGIPAGILGALVGAIITERVYAVPGMGKMLTDAIDNNNNAMIIGLTLIYTLLSVLSVILGDILMAMVDPRISYQSGGRK